MPNDLVAPSRLNDEKGPWILAHAEMSIEDVTTGRRTFGLFNTLLVEQSHLDALLHEMESEGHPGRDLIEVPSDYYVFAGEIPWHGRFARPEPGYTVADLYKEEPWIGRRDLHFEVLAHRFAWEPHHSPFNKATAYVPSRTFSEAFDLRSRPNGFDQVEPSGGVAALPFSAPSGFDGNLLYLRADLVRTYATDRAIVTFGWGEREVQLTWPEEPPEWARRTYSANRNVWRRVIQH